MYLTLGGVLAKDWKCSVADHRWGKPRSNLKKGLRAYLAGIIQQTALAAWVLVALWVNHLFPDAASMQKTLHLDCLGLISAWVETVVQTEIPKLDKYSTNQSEKLAKTREELLSKVGINANSPSSLLSLSPQWPDITSGGPKDLESTRAFSINAMLKFRRCYPARLPQPIGLAPKLL